MIRNEFDRGPEGWCSYDYHASMVADGCNIFILTTWSPTGGVRDAGYVWTDHRRWSADTPERPLSILPLLLYRGWVGQDPVDLRAAEVSVYLRGDGLQLDGARCTFWVHAGHTRWHLTGQPVAITAQRWGEAPTRLRLAADVAQWHKSWSLVTDRPTPLATVLGAAQSYGFAFTGFSSEVTGRLSMAQFEIRTAAD